jgi:coproporphyrinogen III oxidase-like Fe-S oxidoreductase
VERVMLELRLADGLSTALLTPTERDRVADLLARRLAVQRDGKLILTADGRLLADGVIRDLLD